MSTAASFAGKVVLISSGGEAQAWEAIAQGNPRRRPLVVDGGFSAR